jgi:hypothetical protein
MRIVALALLAIMMFVPKAHGQAIYAGRTNGNGTGSMWSEIGTISPVEAGNIIFATGASQGFDYRNIGPFIFTPYVSAGSSLDSYGYDWNNTIAVTGGMKTSVRLSHGVLSANAAYGIEDRFKSGTLAAGPQFYLEDWFGWQLPAKYNRYPGSTWTTLGYTSPIEHGNLIVYGHIQQGVVVARLGKAKRSIVVFGEGTLVRDTQHRDWENLLRVGPGVQITVGHGFSIGTSYLDEHRSISGIHTGGVSVFVKLDTQWGKE